MNPSDFEPGMFYYRTDSGEYKKIPDIMKNMVSISFDLSDEDAARLWALTEGLEII